MLFIIELANSIKNIIVTSNWKYINLFEVAGCSTDLNLATKLSHYLSFCAY